MRLVSLPVLLLCSAAQAQSPPPEFHGFGPLPLRNYQPIQLIFLNLPVERARVLQPGQFTLWLESVETNEISTEQGKIDAVLKFETNRTVLGGSFSPTRNLELSLAIPFISRFGGFLDPLIDAVEEATQTTNSERSLFPDNTFGGFFVRRGDTMLFEGKKQQLELGDLWVGAKYEVWQATGGPTISLRVAVKAPTGREESVFGSGKPDFGLGAAIEYQFFPWLVAYGNLNLVYPLGPITPARLTLNPIFSEALAAEARLWRRLSFLLQQELYTSPFHGNVTRLLDEPVVELTFGFNFDWEPFLFQLGGVENVSPIVAAADFSLLLRVAYRR